ncbi:hypothetical protein D3C81_583580 [compost metagenome]
MAFERLDVGDVVLLPYDQTNTPRVGLFGREINHGFAGRLGKHRRRIGRMAQVNGAGAQGFEQLRARSKFVPADGHPLGGQGFFQRAAAFEDVDAVEFLVADTQGFGRLGSGALAREQECSEHGEQAAGQQATQRGKRLLRHGRTPEVQG